MRSTNFTEIGSLLAASRIDSRATVTGTPAISNSMRPGFTTATQPSTGPLPLPCRTSSGFFVIGLSGKIRTHNLPLRFIARLIETRHASI